MRAEWLKPKWYVLFVRSNQEKCVARHLSSREVEHFLPTYTCLSQWRDRKVKLLKPLFPGYVFVRLLLADRLKALLVPNVVHLVGTRNAPSIVADEEIEWIRRGVAHGKAEPHPCLTAGDLVVIESGHMAGIEGVLIRTQNSTRLLIRLNSISRAFTVEIDNSCVRPAIHKSILRPACCAIRLANATGKTDPEILRPSTCRFIPKVPRWAFPRSNDDDHGLPVLSWRPAFIDEKCLQNSMHRLRDSLLSGALFES